MPDQPGTDPFHSQLDVPVSGGTLRVAVAGPASGVPVVLAVHGVTASHRSWTPVARALDGDVTLLAVDLRGRGASAHLPGPYGIGAHVDDLLTVLDFAGVVAPILAGHSMGAYVAAALAARRPERATGLVLIDGGLPLPLPADADLDAVLQAVLGPAIDRLRRTFESRQAYADFWRSHPALARPGAWTDDVADYVDYDLTGDPPELRSRASLEAVKADSADLLGDEGIRTAVGRTGSPVLLLRAARGMFDEPTPVLPQELVDEWVRSTPGLVDELVEDTNHYLIVLGDREARLVADRIRQAAGLDPRGS